MFGLGTQELVIIFAIFFFVFGVKRLPELGSGLGKAIHNFKSGIKEIGEDPPVKSIEESKDKWLKD